MGKSKETAPTRTLVGKYSARANSSSNVPSSAGSFDHWGRTRTTVMVPAATTAHS